MRRARVPIIGRPAVVAAIAAVAAAAAVTDAPGKVYSRPAPIGAGII